MEEERFNEFDRASETKLPELIAIIKNTPNSIAAELERAPNTTWLSSFKNVLASLRLELEHAINGGQMDPVKCDKVIAQVDVLAVRTEKLIHEDPNGAAPEEIKAELMSGLEAIGQNLENPEDEEQPVDYIRMIRTEIENAPIIIAEELERRSGNNWLAALVSRITSVRGNAELAAAMGKLSQEALQQIKDIADAMVTEIDVYQRNLAIADNPPGEVKTGLLQELRSIQEVI